MTRLPLTVIGGYLGSGKTTLINRLLAADHGLRLAILVNDFGAINIDAALLASSSEDTIELTNGCVCCAMTGDLFFALGDMLDRRPRPDHIIIEASGIADPAKIAAVAQTEPELQYGGILTLVDGLNFSTHMAEPRIADQLRSQVQCADLIVLSKTQTPDPEMRAALGALGHQVWLGADEGAAIFEILHSAPRQPRVTGHAPAHPKYSRWAQADPVAASKQALLARLQQPPSGVLRLKGLIPAQEGGLWEVHLVGRSLDISHRDPDLQEGATRGVIVIGLADLVTPPDIARWWSET